jgi:hypothetical protein
VASASEPPPPPPQHPTPLVAARNAEPPRGPLEASGRIATGRDLDALSAALGSPTHDARLLMFRERFPDLVEALVDAVARDLAGRAFAQLPRP